MYKTLREQEIINPMSEKEFEYKCSKLEVKWKEERYTMLRQLEYEKYNKIFKDIENIVDMI